MNVSSAVNVTALLKARKVEPLFPDYPGEEAGEMTEVSLMGTGVGGWGGWKYGLRVLSCKRTH